jgi:diaphanous 1
VPPSALEPSEVTVKQLHKLMEYEDEEDGDAGGTAKLITSEPHSPSHSPATSFQAPSDWRSTISQNRFSSLFEGWGRPSSPTPTPEKKNVSEPKLVTQHSGNGISASSAEAEETINGGEANAQDFERLLVSFWLHVLCNENEIR